MEALEEGFFRLFSPKWWLNLRQVCYTMKRHVWALFEQTIGVEVVHLNSERYLGKWPLSEWYAYAEIHFHVILWIGIVGNLVEEVPDQTQKDKISYSLASLH